MVHHDKGGKRLLSPFVVVQDMRSHMDSREERKRRRSAEGSRL